MTDILRYMFDTNIFNRLRDGRLDAKALQGRNIYATPIQLEELKAAKDELVRKELVSVFRSVDPMLTPVTFCFDIAGAGYDEGLWSNGSKTHEAMLELLRHLDKASGKKDDHANQTRDILIAEASLKSDSILVSDDSNLRTVMQKFVGTAMSSIGFWPA